MERQEIIKFFKNPKNYPHPVKKVKHISTYISDVFLTGKFAYKIKKPVNYGYLDFTSLAKRKFFINQELKLNRRLSPEMYLDVLKLTQKDGQLRFGGNGQVIECVLKMKEIPQGYLMSNLIRQNKISEKIIIKLAKIIADFHHKANTSKIISSFGSLGIIKRNWQENFIQTKPFIGQIISQQDFNFIKKSIEKFISQNKELFKKRISEEKIRDTHGDLHAGNIFITPKKNFIFDCLEFNQRFRYQDLLNEIAFFTTEMDFAGKKNLSNLFVANYFKFLKDSYPRKLFSFYKCYRAYVRAKVLSFSLNQKGLSNSKKERIKKRVQRYFQLAREYIQEITKPILILGAGLPGIGRSTRLNFLAKKLEAVIIDSDILRQQIKMINYNQKSKFLVYQKMIEVAEKFLRHNKNIILDATFSKEKYRQLVKKLARKLGINYFFIEFYCSDQIAQKRLLKRAKEKSISRADWRVYLKIKKEWQPVKQELNYFKINTALSPEQCVREILKKIEH